MAASMQSRIVAEFLGTFGLLLIGGGTAVFTLPPFEATARDVAVSLAFGAVLLALAYAFGDLSGAHFNPAVTVSLASSGRFKWGDVPCYLIAQILGGIVGIAMVFGIASGGGSAGNAMNAQGFALGSQCFSGFGAPAGCAYSAGAVFLIEVAFTFFLVMVILFSTRSEGSAKNLAPIGIGLTLLLANLIAIPVDGASINPARSFAPAVLSSLWSSGNWAIGQDWIFWVAPILGGLFAALLDRALKGKSS